MDRVNPVYIPRNHLVEEALDAATAGDLAPFERLLDVGRRPFDERPGLRGLRRAGAAELRAVPHLLRHLMDAARAIVEANRFMTLATADAAGVPWASPVWFAPDGEREFLWVSDPDAQHSRNLAVRTELTIVIFDSRVAPADAAALYLSGVAAEADEGIETFSAHSVAQGLPAFTREDVTGAVPLRTVPRAASERWLLGPRSRRVPSPGPDQGTVSGATTSPSAVRA